MGREFLDSKEVCLMNLRVGANIVDSKIRNCEQDIKRASANLLAYYKKNLPAEILVKKRFNTIARLKKIRLGINIMMIEQKHCRHE